jgi:uncharacterized protein involved in response to NO
LRLPPLFGYGFRPFFLAAGLTATLLIPWWVASVTLSVPLATAWPATLWHGHEMVFGFIVAAISGFLLTAVPSWTGQRGFAGWPLVLLTGLWLVGRLLVASSAHWPPLLTAGVDLAFLPVLALMLLPPLLRAHNRNAGLLAALLALCGANGVFYWAVAHGDVSAAHRALVVAIDIVLLLMTVIGGRIVPAFTASALKLQGTVPVVKNSRRLSALAITVMVAVVLLDMVLPDTRLAGACALVAAVVQALRLAQWAGQKTVRQPIVWILHVAYAWLPVGFALKAWSLLAGTPFAAFWLHALTIGAAATMIMAVVTRASLGHTGRPLVVDTRTVLAYMCLTAAAAVRVLGPGLAGVAYGAVLGLSGLFWTAAFVLFLWVYAPILLTPRADGKAG